MPDPITGLTAGASLLSSRRQAKAAKNAAAMQAEAAGEGIAEQRRQFDSLQALLQPYTQAGVPALEAQQAFLGLQGPEAEQAAINRITGGSTFQELSRQGEEAILSRASATGGLRGGNVQAALAQFRPQLLNQLIEQQYGRLGGLTELGQQSAAGVGSAGMKTGANVSNLLAQQGAASAGGELGRAKAFGQMLNIPGQIAGAGGSGGFGGIQAAFSQTPMGSAGFGSGFAYGNQDLGQNF